jgi:phosphoribosyl-dephospho-CoA transferase
MGLELRTHCLLRIAGAGALSAAATAPGWLAAALERAPWVVVRRAPALDGRLPVGVRGRRRAERFAAWLDPGEARECVEPLELAARRSWRIAPRCARVPALAALAAVESIMERCGLGRSWGPVGSAGFELASGVPTATAASDLDLIVRLGSRPVAALAGKLLVELSRLAVHTDVLLETPLGAIALLEYAKARPPFLMRTPAGPRLTPDPWRAYRASPTGC